ncbi:MAG: hypothetical protein JJ974_01580 [Phycisphaerales bacterium]|nr:hypothetical protein [Phycisphaerales bacterium]
MKSASSVALLSILAAISNAQDIRFEILPGIYPLDMSTDGSVIVGNDVRFDPVRWTRGTGVESLGRGTSVLGVGAGTPDVSDDGSKISATIITADGTLATQGLWTEEAGWVDLMPPTPADGGVIDLALGSAWGLSGDGSSVVGLYWRPGNFDTGGAHASIASAPGAVMDLGSSGGNSRANHVNYDGTVVVGWDERFDGVWQPTVWENGVLTRLSAQEGFTTADYVNPDGTIIGGNTYRPIFDYVQATLWHKNGNSWDEQILGVLPGTVGPRGLATVRSMTPDGSKVVGFNVFNPTSPATGFIWTAEDGMIDVKDFLDDQGIDVPSDMIILDLTAISDDGTIMAGIAVSALDGISPIGFRISPACIADFNNDFELDFFDISEFIGAYGDSIPEADINDDGQFDFFDISAYLTAYANGCP